METDHLDTIGFKHGTDKSSFFHDYLRRYEPYLSPIRHSAKLIVEAGIDGGASLKLWRDYFSAALVIGIDHNRASVHDAQLLGDRVLAIFGDATDPETWKKVQALGLSIDFFCDDASHHSLPTVKTFGLVWPLISPGGLYCVEDTHSSYLPAYNRDGPPTTMEFFKQKLDELNETGAGETGKIIHPDTDLAFMHFSKSLLIIGKRS